MPRSVARVEKEGGDRKAAAKAFEKSIKGEGRRPSPPSETSPLIDERRKTFDVNEELDSIDRFVPENETGTICPECGARQYWLPSRDEFPGPDGVTCPEGHTFPGASGVPAPERELSGFPGGEYAFPGDGYTADDRPVGDGLTNGDGASGSFERSRPEMSPDFERIVERVFAVDFAETHARLEQELKLGGRASQADRATVADALDRSQDNAREAHRLYAAGRVELEAFELDAKATLGDLRAQATAALEDEKSAKKAAKQGAKQITEADVEAWIAAHHHDEWRDLQLRRKRAEKTVEHLERLSELWRSRSRTLEALLSSART